MNKGMLQISNTVSISSKELKFNAIRAQGSGGQHVNKVSSAIHLHFDIRNSSLPDFYKKRLLALNDSRLTKNGVIVIKSQEHRTQKMNHEAALIRLYTLIKSAIMMQKKRRPSKSSHNSQKKRMDSKTKHGNTKRLRNQPNNSD